jgi:hypothetical protein
MYIDVCNFAHESGGWGRGGVLNLHYVG